MDAHTVLEENIAPETTSRFRSWIRYRTTGTLSYPRHAGRHLRGIALRLLRQVLNPLGIFSNPPSPCSFGEDSEGCDRVPLAAAGKRKAERS